MSGQKRKRSAKKAPNKVVPSRKPTVSVGNTVPQSPSVNTTDTTETDCVQTYADICDKDVNEVINPKSVSISSASLEKTSKPTHGNRESSVQSSNASSVAVTSNSLQPGQRPLSMAPTMKMNPGLKYKRPSEEQLRSSKNPIIAVPLAQTEIPQDDEDDDWDEDESSEADDDGRIYKNPRNSPSSECPRDEEQATLLGQKCLRKCSSDEDCKSKKKKCLCDGVCGMSCIKPDRECPELAQPSLGQVTLTGRHFGQRASYSCPHGYHVVGLQSRLCQADGNWAGAEPACKQNIYCLKPPKIEHARNSALPEQETFDLDSTVQYHCHNGYVTNGFPRAKCLAIDGQASWYGPDIQCEPRSCGQPPDPANGWHSGECYTYGCKITYNCGTGYELVGKHERTCQSDGSWTPKELPTCVSPCLVPSVENGKYYKVEPHTIELSDKPSLTPLSTYEEIQSNEFITLECEEGYKIQGAGQLRCGHGSWSVNAFSKCVSVACTLPNIPGLIYEGGYRAGLTIGQDSSVNARCNYSTNTLPIEMTCSRGTIKPQNIQCESGMRKSREEIVKITDESNEKISNTNVLDTSDMEESSNSTDDQNATEESKMCGPPTITDGALIYKNSDMDIEGIYESGTEIYFNCIPSASGERNTWKIICENGEWIGRSYNCANGTCLFKNNEPNVVSFYNDLEIREDIVEFPPGATITSRCTDIGKFELVGSIERTCIHSEWTGVKPQCFGLNQENDYAMEKAPTILFRRHNGPIAQSNDGKLIVYPGTTLHMECLWMRRFGNPKWSVSHDYKNYSEGWVTEEGRDPTLEYRLTIADAQTDDSGIYSCETPARHKHSVEIVVKSINCPEIPTRRGLIVSTNETKLSVRVLLSCSNGNSLIGSSELFCLPSGNWSAPLPVCESVECGDIPLPNNITSPRVSVLSREVGGRAAFSCPSGYGLRGPSESICMPSGEWATPFPTCVEVQCENPGAPQNGYAQGTPPYRAGDVVQFNCNPEYMMQGQPIIACQDNGRWSGGLPKCVQACSYPGTAISGHMSSVQFYYAIGESITFTCDAGLELRGPKMVKCLKNGKWSGAIPQCVALD
ncbi:sushi, von Willebrand factor type A, EGF and pentraxin domain-containing protein 1 [Musca vetustissima]|uniref:sushi, von Willebrand factor type A, EGF and pentraxin domain-containing protein 1 n=1 Tax=Musca vetustissima TaxID=27455 RepID=UPI002AB5F74A|nr:sushi, von Willebrand factor type A, EGF and pentraxin domain-containing protein 1 [Musca vetustissima]